MREKRERRERKKRERQRERDRTHIYTVTSGSDKDEAPLFHSVHPGKIKKTDRGPAVIFLHTCIVKPVLPLLYKPASAAVVQELSGSLDGSPGIQATTLLDRVKLE